MGKIEEKKKKKKSPIFIFAIGFLVSGIVLSQIISAGCSVYQNELNTELKRHETLLAEEVNNGKKLEIEIEQMADKFAIEEYAVNKLNMQKIKNYQIQYVETELHGYAELLAPEEETAIEKMARPFSIIMSFFGN